MNKIALLRTIPIFDSLSRAHLMKIGQIAEEIVIPEGKVLVREGDKITDLFFIVEGKAKALANGKVLKTYNANDYFGEVSLIDGEPSPATFIAETDMKLLVVESQYFWTMVEKTPTMIHGLLVALCRHVRRGAGYYRETAQKQGQAIS